MPCEKTRQSSKRRVKKMQSEAEECARQTGAKGAMQEMDYSRLGAGLGAAGLASGLASSHFERVGLGVGLEVGEVGELSRLSGMSWLWAWSVETMDCLLLSGGGAVL